MEAAASTELSAYIYQNALHQITEDRNLHKCLRVMRL
jgi:hypothetical protein